MVPLFFSLSTLLDLMVIRDYEPSLGRHPSLNKKYNIFEDMALRDPRQSKSKESTSHLDLLSDPEYYGFITLIKPGSKYSYTCGGLKHLSNEELVQLVKRIGD